MGNCGVRPGRSQSHLRRLALGYSNPAQPVSANRIAVQSLARRNLTGLDREMVWLHRPESSWCNRLHPRELHDRPHEQRVSWSTPV